MSAWLEGVIRSARIAAASLGELVLPPSCPSCGDGRIGPDALCEKCAAELLSMVSLPYCPRCGASIGPNIPIRPDGCNMCPPTLPRFASVVRLGPYAGVLRLLVRRLKYRKREEICPPLARMICESLQAGGDGRFDVVVPVPMHWLRRLSRSYDHTLELARQIAGPLNLSVGQELTRIRNTPPQVNLPRSSRWENVKGCFAARGGDTITGARVLLVDDVVTTGATADQAAKTLLEAGASRVELAVIAKSEPPTAYSQRQET